MNRSFTFLVAAGLVAFSAAGAPCATRIFRPGRPDDGDTNIRALQPIDEAAWIAHPATGGRGAKIHRFSREFEAAPGERLTIDVSADERFTLLLDGEFIARGPHRGLPHHWLYQTYDIDLKPGRHTLTAVVTVFGEDAPIAQLSCGGGFILKASGVYHDRLTTGRAEWRVAELRHTRLTGKGTSGTYGVGSQCEVRGTSLLTEEPAESVAAVVARPAVADNPTAHYGIVLDKWRLHPSILPDQLRARRTPGRFRAARHDAALREPYAAADADDELVAAFNRLLKDGKPAVTLPPRTKMRLVWDLEDYYCAYPELVLSGGKGARVTWGWAEALRGADGAKGRRDACAGLAFSQSFDDVFVSDGRQWAYFTTPWFRPGKWIQLAVETGDEPLVVGALGLVETRYPFEPEASFACSDASIDAVVRLCVRGLQMCMHEMYFDCPYYEQQMYPGDGRVEFLTTGLLTADDRLVRHSIEIYDRDRRTSGLIAMNAPTRGTQESSTYTMCYLAMLGDFARWRVNPPWLKARVPGLVHTAFALAAHERADGLLGKLPGWSFMDWVNTADGSPATWPTGIAPCGPDGVSAPVNLQYLMALRACEGVMSATGGAGMAAHFRAKGDRLARRISEVFWCDARGMLADDPAKTAFSEHAQALAIVLDVLDEPRRARAFAGLTTAKDLARCTVYFSHYLFEAFFRMNRPDLFLSRLDLWRGYVAQGLKTPLESPGKWARSDCHAWGSHPLYHLHAGIAGVRPAADAFASVRVAPQPGGLSWYKSKTPHPRGLIEQDLSFADGGVKGTVVLPDGLSGEFVWRGATRKLAPGANPVEIRGP